MKAGSLNRFLVRTNLWTTLFLAIWFFSSYGLYESTRVYTDDFPAYLQVISVHVLLLMAWVAFWMFIEKSVSGSPRMRVHLCIGAAFLAFDSLITDLTLPWSFYALSVAWQDWVSNFSSLILLCTAIDRAFVASLRSAVWCPWRRCSLNLVVIVCFAILTYAEYQRQDAPPVIVLNAHSQHVPKIVGDQPISEFLDFYFSIKSD